MGILHVNITVRVKRDNEQVAWRQDGKEAVSGVAPHESSLVVMVWPVCWLQPVPRWKKSTI